MINLSYQELYKLNKEGAIMRLFKTLDLNYGNIKKTARELNTYPRIVRKYQKRRDNNRPLIVNSAPHITPLKTPSWIERLIEKERKKTNYGRIRMADHLVSKYGIFLPEGTIQNIFKRKKLTKQIKRRGKFKGVTFYDFSSIYPLEHFQIDLKEIPDIKSLPYDVYSHLMNLDVPLYQWTAIDVYTRIRFIAYSYEKTFANGMAFMRLLDNWVRMFGFSHKLYFQTDHGEEFGGKRLTKIQYLQKEYFTPLNIQLLKTRKGKPTDNAYVERSHRTDDEEFYSPHLLEVNNETDLLRLSSWWLRFYNTKRKHYGWNMEKLTPFQKLKKAYPWIQERFCCFPSLILDYLTTNDMFSLNKQKTTPKGRHEVVNYYKNWL